MFNPRPSFSLDSIGLSPIVKSEIETRDLVDTSTNFLGFPLSLPIITSPMNTVVGLEMAAKLEELGGLSFLPRSNDFEHDLALARSCKLGKFSVIPSIPVAKDYIERTSELYKMGYRHFLIDIANGFHSLVESAVKNLRAEFSNIFIITGNVASVEGFKFLAGLGVNAIRVGVGTGSMCRTTAKTAVGVNMASLIRDVAETLGTVSKGYFPFIIADGGLKGPADIIKCLALGADICMSGRLFAGHTECPGQVIQDKDGKKYKVYAGQTSRLVKGNDKNVEGTDSLIDYQGPLEKSWRFWQEAMRSAMSYMNCQNIDQLVYQSDDCFVNLLGNR